MPSHRKPLHVAMSLRVAFLHPDLGLGGAERLVVDAASGLSKLVRILHAGQFNSSVDKRALYSSRRATA
jgi:hypothetical protein